MRMTIHSAATATVAAAALLATVVAVPTEAFAGTPAVTITQPTPGLPYAYSFGDQHGVMSAYAEEDEADGATSPAPVVSVTLHFHLQGDAPGAPDDLTVPLVRSNPEFGYWDSATAVKLPHFGTYNVDAEVTDQQGNDVIMQGVGTDTSSADVSVTSLLIAPGTVDYDHRTVTVSGHVVVTDPNTGHALVPDQLKVQLTSSSGWASPQPVVADAEGNFTTTATVYSGPTIAFSTYTVTGTGSTPYQLVSSVTSKSVGIVQEATRIRLLEPADYYVSSGPVLLKGVVERLDGTTWLPASGLTVASSDSDMVDEQTSGPDGTFQAQVPFAGSYSFSTVGDSNQFGLNGIFLKGSSSASVRVHIPAQTYFSWLSYSEDPIGEAHIQASLNTGGNQLVQIQHSTDGRTWHYVGSMATKNGTFDCYAWWGGNGNGYWRLYFAGTPDLKPAYSSVMYLYLTPTRLTGGLPSVRHAYPHETEHFSGSLQQDGRSGWTAIGGAPVYLLWRATGSKQWKVLAESHTNSRGQYALSAGTPGSGTWSVVYAPADGRHLDANGPMTWVGA
jgi:hypothetical protein